MANVKIVNTKHELQEICLIPCLTIFWKQWVQTYQTVLTMCCWHFEQSQSGHY